MVPFIERDHGSGPGLKDIMRSSLILDEKEVPLRYSKDGKQTINKYMSLELSGKIKTGDKN